MADSLAVHVLRSLKKLTHDCAHQILAKQLAFAVFSLEFLFPIGDKLGQAKVAGELEHQVGFVYLGVFVEGH